jgi:hypothetical protein
MARRVLVASIVVAALTCLGASAAKKPSRVNGMFSDMKYVAEAGDAIGTEVLIVVGTPGGGTVVNYFVYCQTAGGAPDPPVLVPAKVDGANVEFTMPAPWGTFRGTVSEAALTGEFQGTKTRVRLRRGKSYWQ